MTGRFLFFMSVSAEVPAARVVAHTKHITLAARDGIQVPVAKSRPPVTLSPSSPASPPAPLPSVANVTAVDARTGTSRPQTC